jgi:hypothetical protein
MLTKVCRNARVVLVCVLLVGRLAYMAGSLIKYVNKDWADKSGLPELDFAAQDTFTNPSMLYTMNSILRTAPRTLQELGQYFWFV